MAVQSAEQLKNPGMGASTGLMRAEEVLKNAKQEDNAKADAIQERNQPGDGGVTEGKVDIYG